MSSSCSSVSKCSLFILPLLFLHILYPYILPVNSCQCFQLFFSFRNRQVIVKVNDFFENTAVQMTPRLFRRYFRMNRNTLHNLTNYMSQVPLVQPLRLNTRSISLAKKMAMTCCYLGSSASTIQ